MYKRIIAVLLCCTLCAGFLILPAAASSVSDDGLTDAGTQYINYLVGNSYLSYDSYWNGTQSPSYDYTDSERFGFKWTPADFETGSYMLFAIRSLSRPSLVNVRFSPSGSYTAATYEGAIPSAGNLYFYRISMPSNPDQIEIFGRFDSLYTGTITVASCFGVRNLLSVYDRAEFTFVAIERKTEGYFVDSTYNEGVKFFPYTAPSWLSSTDYIDRVDYTIRCDGDRFNTSAVGKVQLLFNTFSDSMTVTASLVSKDSNVRDIKSIKVNLYKDDSWGVVNQYEVGIGLLYNYNAYQVDFDLSGYDMSNYDLQLFVSIPTVPYVDTGSVGEPEIFSFTFRSMQYVPTVISSPWYQPILSRISFVASEISSTFNIGINNVTKFLTTQYNNFTSWLQQQLFNVRATIQSTGQNIINSLSSLLGYDSDQEENINSSVDQNQQQQEQVQDQGESMKDQIEEIEKAEQEMLQVPEIDPGRLQLGTLIPESGMTMMTNVMVTLTENDVAAPIILLVVSIALVGVMVL